MRVLHVIADAAGGGLERVMLEAVGALAEAGLEQEVLARGGDPQGPRLLEGAPATVTVAPFDRLWKGRTIAAIQRALQGFRPHVVHYWSGYAAGFAPPSSAQRSLGWYAAYEMASRFRLCAWHAGQTRDVARHIASQGVAADRIAVLARCTRPLASPAALERASLDTPESAPLAFHESRFEPDCAVGSLLHALRHAPQVHAWISGDGPMLRAMQGLAGELDLESRVRFLGARPDRTALIAASDVVISPSRLRPWTIP